MARYWPFGSGRGVPVGSETDLSTRSNKYQAVTAHVCQFPPFQIRRPYPSWLCRSTGPNGLVVPESTDFNTGFRTKPGGSMVDRRSVVCG